MLRKLWGARWLGSGRDPLSSALGRLEREVMEIAWHGGGLSVREVQAKLGRPVAYTTVMTTLDRLFKKGFVTRRREGRAFVYTAVLARHEMEAAVTAGLLKEALSADSRATRPFLSNLVDAVAERDGTLLDELERLVRAKRDRLRNPQA